MNAYHLPLKPALTTLALFLALGLGSQPAQTAPLPGGSLDPTAIPKYVTPLVIPPVQPPVLRKTDLPKKLQKVTPFDTQYEIAAKQFEQQVLPAGFPKTTVWGYGNLFGPAPGKPGSTFNWPAYTVETRKNEVSRVTWTNALVDSRLRYLPHLFAVDQTLHWANPARECLEGPARTDCMGSNPLPYQGPVPLVTHLHGAHVDAISDGYPEAWNLPLALNIPRGYARTGSNYASVRPTLPGSAVYEYDNSQEATALWYHDHTLGMTRLNVYAGLAGFWLIRDQVEEGLNLPGPAPVLGEDPNGDPAVRAKLREIPILIQDRSFNADGSFFYPAKRAFFEGLEPDQLNIDFIPAEGPNGMSDVAPLWNPEAFFNTMTVNGATWPIFEVEPDQYRLRLLNGCNSRFLILKLATDSSPGDGSIDDGDLAIRPDPFHQIGSDGGLLPNVATQSQLLLGPAERADVIVDFSTVPVGTLLYLVNFGPDEPFGGGDPGTDFDGADPATTGQVMVFRVVADSAQGEQFSGLPTLPAITPLPQHSMVRQVSLNEEESASVCVKADPLSGDYIVPIEQVDCNQPIPGFDVVPFGPTAAKLGTLTVGGDGNPINWGALITENPNLGDTEIWEIFNFTEDAHPIHLHLVQFQILGREPFGGSISVAGSNQPLPWETGVKDMVIVYPGEVARIKATFDKPGLYVWHCHILEHEDNEMMRPMRVGAGPLEP